MFGLIFDWVKNPSNILQASGTASHNTICVSPGEWKNACIVKVYTPYWLFSNNTLYIFVLPPKKCKGWYMIECPICPSKSYFVLCFKVFLFVQEFWCNTVDQNKVKFINMALWHHFRYFDLNWVFSTQFFVFLLESIESRLGQN